MKKFKLISICTVVMVVLSTILTFNKVNAATVQATVTYGEIENGEVEATVKFAKDISEYTFSEKWTKVDKNTLKIKLKEGGCAYAKIVSSNGDIEEGIVAMPIKMEVNEVFNIKPSDSNISITNLKTEDTSIATVQDELKIKAVKEGTTKITGDVKFNNDDGAKKCTWNLKVTKKETQQSDEKPSDEKPSDEKPADSTKDNTKVELTKEEIKEIESFINDEKLTNTGFLFINYTNPEELVKKIANESEGEHLNVSAIDHLRYAIIHSGYGKEANNEQLIKIYGSLDGANGSTILMTEEDLIKFFKDRINYEYTKEQIKEDLKEHYNESVDAYVFNASDAFYGKFEMKSGYKIGDKFHIEIEYPNTTDSSKTETISLVMEKVNGKYTFYSCNNSEVKATNDKKDETTADGKIQQTGINNTILLVIAFGAIIGTVSIIGFRKYKNIK